MTEIIPAVLSSPKDARSFLYEEFGLSLYEGALDPLPYTGSKGDESYKIGTDSFCDLDSSLFLTDPVTGGNWCPPFTDFGLFPDPFGNEFPSDTPTSSFPSTPVSCSSGPLSPEDQQEIDDIVSSFQTPPTILSPSEITSADPPSLPLLSPLPSPFPSPLPSPSSSSSSLGKHSRNDISPPPPPPSKRTSKLSLASRKERKKEQNKTAALRYRQKKRSELDSLLKQEEELEHRNKKLRSQVDSLSTEIAYLKNLWSEVRKAKGQYTSTEY